MRPHRDRCQMIAGERLALFLSEAKREQERLAKRNIRNVCVTVDMSFTHEELVEILLAAVRAKGTP